MGAEFCVELYDNSASGMGPGVKLAEFWDARNIGWSRYDRIPGKAFLTLSQNSPLLGDLAPLTTHVAITRITPSLTKQVYAGQFIDYTSTGDDVILDFYDYVTLLSISRAGFQTLYPNRKLGTEIVSPEWSNAKGATYSPLSFVATGPIEDPVATDGSTVITTNAGFGTMSQMRLQLFYDLSEIGRANTAHHVTFDISKEAPYTFRFRKDVTTDSGLGLILNGNVSNYAYAPGWTRYRNDVATVGLGSAGGDGLITKTDEAEAAAKGRRQDVFTIKTLLGIAGAATVSDQQNAVADRQLKLMSQAQPALWLALLPGVVDPFDGWDVCDKATIEISNGKEALSGLWRIVGVRDLVTEPGEALQVLVAPVLT